MRLGISRLFNLCHLLQTTDDVAYYKERGDRIARRRYNYSDSETKYPAQLF